MEKKEDKTNPYMKGVKPNRLTATEVRMLEREFEEKGYTTLAYIRTGHKDQLDRIERMLKHLVIKNQIDFLAIVLRDCPDLEGKEWHYSDIRPMPSEAFETQQKDKVRIRKKCLKEIERLKKLLPDISDIIEEKRPKKVVE
jgi:hypothetical protein